MNLYTYFPDSDHPEVVDLDEHDDDCNCGPCVDDRHETFIYEQADRMLDEARDQRTRSN